MAKGTKTATPTPTSQSYTELDKAYAFFNRKLFAGGLPPCLITLHRHPKARGYHWAEKYEHANGRRTVGEVALNPDHFKSRSVTETLSTLVHEMVHVWQHAHGKPTRNGYHNQEWAKKMDALGLTPSDTGEPGGKCTGQRVTHYIVKGGPFAAACAELLKTGLAVTWRSVPKPADEGKSGKRTKYECDGCRAAVWGKEGLHLVCGECNERMEPPGS